MPRGAMRLRHHSTELDLPEEVVPLWSTPLPGLGPRLALTSADGLALLVQRDGVAVLGADSSGDAGTWRRIALPPGRCGTAVAGPFPWVCDDGRLLRWTPEGAVDEIRISADAALALDTRRVLIAPRGAPGELALVGDGAELWRGKGTLADASPAGAELMIVGVPGDAERIAALDLVTGRTRWRARPHPHRLGAVVAVFDGAVWVACTDRTLAAMQLDDGRVVHAHDTGVRPPTGAVDPGGRLHICHERVWVTIRLTVAREVAERLRLTGGPFIDPPLPVAGGRLLVRSASGELWLLSDAGSSRLWHGRHPVRGVAGADGRLYLLEGGEAPVLHCLVGRSSAR